MELVNLVGKMEELDRCLDKCCESGCFHIEPAFSTVGTANGLTMLNEKNGYTAQLKAFERLAADLGIELVETDYSDYAPRTPEEFAKALATASRKRTTAKTKRCRRFPK